MERHFISSLVQMSRRQYATGSIKWFKKGQGFIAGTAGESDIFAHHSNINVSQGAVLNLPVGEVVQYDISKDFKGRTQAVNIRTADGKPFQRILPKSTGVVKWYDLKKKFGYITAADGKDVAVFLAGIRNPKGDFPYLWKGDAVEFEVDDMFQYAVNVTALGGGPFIRRQTGTVKWWNPITGMGYINIDGEENASIHAHTSQVQVTGESPKALVEGAAVEFEARPGVPRTALRITQPGGEPFDYQHD
eukprot:NODE_1325_length_965_cov_395.024017_g1020_i0.p1 GENE.NODE_1325_length_965_cov_395.024017_g1020_i0~~NODE_1325_length_965_cov_395.024017_g1020_i0.p1  ORF type:complete len:267 (-),score=72.95 NODE_1325_length_965_cov_395.024017_g1020_i0:164-904(-)